MTAGPADQVACTRAVIEGAPDAAIVANLGVASWVLATVDDRERNFYMRGGMGSTTPTGFGLALAVDGPVVVLDGDGSLLMGLGSLPMIAARDPANLVVVVWDNGAFGTTGSQPTLSSVVDFAAVAEDCGLAGFDARTDDGFADAFAAAVDHEGAALVSCAVGPVDAGAPPGFDYPHAYLTDRFRRAVAGE